MGGAAIRDAVTKLQEIISATLAPSLNCSPGQVVFKDDCLWGEQLSDENATKKLMELPQQEKMYLAEYLKKDASSLKFCYSTGPINGLKAKGVVYLASNLSSSGDIFPYNIQPWVSEAIEKNTDLKNH